MSALRLVMIGAGIALLIVGGMVGLWSMTIAPPPPSIARAQQMATEDNARLQEAFDELIRHQGGANTAVTTGKPDRALAHTLMMQEVTTDILRGSLSTVATDAQKAEVKDRFCTTQKLARNLAPSGHPLLSVLVLNDPFCNLPIPDVRREEARADDGLKVVLNAQQ